MQLVARVCQIRGITFRGKTQEFAVVGKIREFRDGCKKFTALMIDYPTWGTFRVT